MNLSRMKQMKNIIQNIIIDKVINNLNIHRVPFSANFHYCTLFECEPILGNDRKISLIYP